ncbi:MAG TPA: long-chain fatty acid--CoA ligase [Actinomycetota bacterium]|nr:long-chain fatty acid--CoA ligase [Actinomycetota bacterium]
MSNVAVFAEEAMERFGDYEAVTYVSLAGPDTTHRSGELYALSHKLTSGLRRLGVEPGDRVVVMIPNAPEITVIYSAIARCGGVILPILFLLADNEIRHILADAEPRVVITSSEFFDRMRAAASTVPSVRHLICLDAAPDGGVAFADVVGAEDARAEMTDRSDDDLALLIYTGGTTGRPKGVMLTHGNLTFAARAAATVSREENGITSDDVGLSSLPLAHSFGVLVWLVGTQIGGKGVLLRWFDPATFFRCIEEYRCTTTAVVPTMITYLVGHPDGDTRDTSSLRLVTSGAAPLPVEVGRAFEERFGCTILEGWGLTESIGLGTVNRVHARRWGSIGKPMPGVEVAVRDPESDREVATGELGEICMRGPHVMPGYWKLPEETQTTLRGGWLRTGDVGYVDDDGFLFIVDRVKDLIIRGGFNIYPRDVEEVLHAHPAVLEAAVVGVPDPAMGQEVKAFVVLKPGASATEEELASHCRGQLASYKCPKAFSFLDMLPKSGVGKILRRELRERAGS